jgi:hypothetical protein
MRRSYVFVALAAAAACFASAQAARQDFRSSVPRRLAFDRVMTVLADFGYTVTDANRDAGFVKAERKSSSATADALSGKGYLWELTVTVLPDSQGTRFVVQPQNVRDEGGRRSTSGMMITKAQVTHVDSVVARLRDGD